MRGQPLAAAGHHSPAPRQGRPLRRSAAERPCRHCSTLCRHIWWRRAASFAGVGTAR